MSISLIRVRRERAKPVESIIPLVVVDPKGKELKTSFSKPRKKRKKTRAFAEGASKKAKLMASTMSTTQTAKVYFELLFGFMLILKF